MHTYVQHEHLPYYGLYYIMLCTVHILPRNRSIQEIPTTSTTATLLKYPPIRCVQRYMKIFGYGD